MVTVTGEDTAPNITPFCGDYPCDQHYVVRDNGLWVRAFHNEREAKEFVEASPRAGLDEQGR